MSGVDIFSLVIIVLSIACVIGATVTLIQTISGTRRQKARMLELLSRTKDLADLYDEPKVDKHAVPGMIIRKMK